jgi:nucleoside-diphosphate-sugar epimerase
MDAYAGVKLAAIEIIKSFSGTCNLDWVWFRVFSVLGEKENRNWLIPSVVTKMQNDLEMDFTKGEQKYAYMYIKDFTEIIFRTLKHDIKSGIYNISGKHAKSLRSIIESIRDIVNPNFKLNFGAVDYRINQSMHIEGNISKLTSEIGEVEFTNFSVALNNVISYYNNKKVL